MKKTITGVVMLLAGACITHAQGTVSFANYLGSTYIYVSYKPASGSAIQLGGAATGPAPSTSNYAAETGNGTDWTAQLWGAAGSGDTASALSPLPLQGGSAGATVTSTFASGSSGHDSTAGTWLSTAVGTVPGTTYEGSAATVQVYAWYNDGGTITSYSQAVSDGVPAGFSATANISTGGPVPPGQSGTPAVPAALPAGLGNFTVSVPEPSTVALGMMGASALFMRLRRK